MELSWIDYVVYGLVLAERAYKFVRDRGKAKDTTAKVEKAGAIVRDVAAKIPEARKELKEAEDTINAIKDRYGRPR